MFLDGAGVVPAGGGTTGPVVGHRPVREVENVNRFPADVDVPDAKLQMTMEIRKNTEAQFPASHTIDIKFTPGPDSPVGSVKQIDVPQMRREDSATGDALVGVPVTITNNSFLVGLTREAEARNVEAMRTRGWFDIPMVLVDGKPAKITFEKGASGDRILADALTAWAKTP